MLTVAFLRGDSGVATHSTTAILLDCQAAITAVLPQDLIVDGLYKALALALYPGPFWPISVVLVARGHLNLP